MELLVLGIAQHQAVVGIPQHEGLRDVLDGIHQPELGLLVELVGFLLLGDVEDDADEMRLAGLVARRKGSTRARSHTQWPSSWRMRNSWSKAGDLALQQAFDRASSCVSSRVERLSHLLEAEKVALHRHAEDVEHGARPEDDALGDVPVPHAALAAVERLVEARRGNAEHRRRPQPPSPPASGRRRPASSARSSVTTNSIVTLRDALSATR